MSNHDYIQQLLGIEMNLVENISEEESEVIHMTINGISYYKNEDNVLFETKYLCPVGIWREVLNTISNKNELIEFNLNGIDYIRDSKDNVFGEASGLERKYIGRFVGNQINTDLPEIDLFMFWEQ
jgi:hypothetical protein